MVRNSPFRQTSFQAIAASRQQGLFNLRDYLSHYVEPGREIASVAEIGVCIAEEVLGEEIFRKLWESESQRTLRIQLPGATEEENHLAAALARVPWEIARPAMDKPTLGERNLLVRVVHDMQASPTEPLEFGKDECLRVLFVFAEARGSRPLAARLFFLSACHSGDILRAKDWNEFMAIAQGKERDTWDRLPACQSTDEKTGDSSAAPETTGWKPIPRSIAFDEQPGYTGTARSAEARRRPLRRLRSRHAGAVRCRAARPDVGTGGARFGLHRFEPRLRSESGRGHHWPGTAGATHPQSDPRPEGRADPACARQF